MADRKAEVLIEFNAKMQNLNNAIKNLSERMQNISSIAKKAGAALSGIAVGGIALMKSWTDEARTNEEMNNKLKATLQSTGQVAGMTYESMKKLSAELQKQTGYAQANIDEMNSLLLTFTRIGSDVFPEVSKATINLNRALGKDGAGLMSTVQMVGKALNEPISGLSALRRVGIQFTEEQEAMIKNFVAMGDVTNAQKVILAELNTQFGAASEKYMLTLNGRIADMTNRFNDLKAQIGEKLLPVFVNLIDKYIIPLINWFASLDDKTISLIAKVTLLTTAFAAIAGPLLLIIGFIPQIVAGFKSINVVFTAMTGTVGILTAKITALVAIFTTAYKLGKKLSNIPVVANIVDKLVNPFANIGLEQSSLTAEAQEKLTAMKQAQTQQIIVNNPIFDREQKLNEFQRNLNNNQAVPAMI